MSPSGRLPSKDVVDESQSVHERQRRSERQDNRQHSRKESSLGQSSAEATKKSYHPDQTVAERATFTENDVLCGRGTKRSGHNGNVKFRKFIQQHQPRFWNADTASNRHEINHEVVLLWRELNPPGRFLTERSPGEWFDIGDKQAHSKVFKALGEKRYSAAKAHVAKPVDPKLGVARELESPPTNPRKRTQNPVVACQASSHAVNDNASKKGRKGKRQKLDPSLKTLHESSRNASGIVPERLETLVRAGEAAEMPPVPYTPRIQKIREEAKLLQKSLRPLESYVEETGFLHQNPVLPFEELQPLPQAECLPDIPQHCSAWANWQDEKQRILLADFSGIQEIDAQGKEFLSRMMQRDDITVITQGVMHGLRQELWSQAAINHVCGNRWYHKFRHFQWDPVKETYMEQNGYLSMKVGDFCKYLDQRECFLNHKNDKDKVFQFFTGQTPPREIKLDVEKDVIYMLDLDMSKLLPQMYQDFINSFKIKEMLPGGEWCMMNKVRNSQHQQQRRRLNCPEYSDGVAISLPFCCWNPVGRESGWWPWSRPSECRRVCLPTIKSGIAATALPLGCHWDSAATRLDNDRNDGGDASAEAGMMMVMLGVVMTMMFRGTGHSIFRHSTPKLGHWCWLWHTTSLVVNPAALGTRRRWLWHTMSLS